MPYAYTTTIKHQYEASLLNIWITFSKAMKRSSDPLASPVVYDIMPPLALWLLTIDTVAVNIVDSAWQDEFTLLLTSDTVAVPPDEVFLAYNGPDIGLRTAWDKQWEFWGDTLSENISLDYKDLTFNHLVRTGSAPTIVAGTGAGTGPTLSIAGTDAAGIITLTVGTTPAANAIIATITFNRAYAAAPIIVVIFQSFNAAAPTALSSGRGIGALNITGSLFELRVSAGVLTAGAVCVWHYIAIG